MRPTTHRTRGRVAPPPESGREQPPRAASLTEADDDFGGLGVVELRFTPSLSWRAFQRFVRRHSLVHTPQRDEPQIFLSPSGIEVAYGKYNRSPLPRQVEELWLVGADSPNVDGVLALVAVMLDTWPHASWTPSKHDDFTPILRQHFPDREGVRAQQSQS
jgi:hypothetical protein